MVSRNTFMLGMDVQPKLASSNATLSFGITLPDVTAIIAAYNEKDVIEQAVADLNFASASRQCDPRSCR